MTEAKEAKHPLKIMPEARVSYQGNEKNNFFPSSISATFSLPQDPPTRRYDAFDGFPVVLTSHPQTWTDINSHCALVGAFLAWNGLSWEWGVVSEVHHQPWKMSNTIPIEDLTTATIQIYLDADINKWYAKSGKYHLEIADEKDIKAYDSEDPYSICGASVACTLGWEYYLPGPKGSMQIHTQLSSQSTASPANMYWVENTQIGQNPPYVRFESDKKTQEDNNWLLPIDMMRLQWGEK